MPALYAHTTRPVGLTLTADIYNTDHQNHITNGDAAGMGGHSTNVTQMQASLDPGEVGSENTAASSADEFEQLRFIIKEMKNTVYWYTSTVTRKESLQWVSRVNATGAPGDPLLWPADIAVNYFVHWRVPEAWAGGDVTFTWVRIAGAADGLVVMNRSVTRVRVSDGSVAILSDTGANYTPASTAPVELSFTAAGASLAVGDVLAVLLQRNGADAGDTMTSFVQCGGAFVSFTSYAGRP